MDFSALPNLHARWRRLAVVSVAVALLAAAVLQVIHATGSRERTLTATFAQTVNLYPGAQVKVLGVQVGTVTSVRVVGTAVRVQMQYAGVELPRDVRAMIVPPSIVGDRFVQLTPAWTAGPTLPDGAGIGLNRTEVPLELDQTYRELDDLSRALGPHGANKSGALTRLVEATARTLDGNGEQFNTTLTHLASALDTLAAIDPSYQRTLDQTGDLTRTLQGNDATIRRLVLSLVRVTTMLAAQRQDIQQASTDLSGALRDVAIFTRGNRTGIAANVAGIREVSATLNRRVRELDDLLTLAPVGFVDALNINVSTNYDLANAHGSSLPGRTTSYAQRGIFTTNLGPQISSVLTSVCETVRGAQRTQLAPLCTAFAAAGNNLGLLLSELANNGKPSNGPDSANATKPTWQEFLARLRAESGTGGPSQASRRR